MDAGKMNVNFVDDQLDGISGIVTSPELFKPLAFRFDDWRGAMIYNTATDATLYNSCLGSTKMTHRKFLLKSTE
jgi:hypothetical protein